MAKFNYKMQNIFELKLKLEEQQKMFLMLARFKLEKEEETLEVLYNRKKNYESEFKKSCEDKVDIDAVKKAIKAFNDMDYFIEQQKIEIKKAEGNVAVEENKMIEVMKDRKTHEKLREKAYERFIDEMEHKESVTVDELVSYKYGTKEQE